MPTSTAKLDSKSVCIGEGGDWDSRSKKEYCRPHGSKRFDYI